MPRHGPYDEHQVVRISAASAVAGVLVVVLAIVGQRVVVAAHRPLSWAVAAVVAAVLIDPLVTVLGRRIPRVLAVLGALLVAGIAVFGVVYTALDNMSAGLDRLGNSAQDAAEQIEDRDDNVGQLARDIDAERRVEDFVDALENRATGGEEVLATTAGTAPAYLVGAILTVFFVSYGPRLVEAGLSQFVDDSRRDRLVRIVGPAVGRARRAVALTLIEGIAAGVAVGLAARALEVPAPAALGLIAGLMALLPHVGLTLGTVPLLLLVLGLRSDGVVVAAVIAGVVVVVQLLDSQFVRPRVAACSVHVGLLVPWMVTLVGYAVYGVGGAAYGLAFAVFGLAVLDEIDRDATERGEGDGDEGEAPPAAAPAAAPVTSSAAPPAGHGPDRPANAPSEAVTPPATRA